LFECFPSGKVFTVSAAEKYIPHYTLADYQTWEGQWELWAGVPVAMTPSPFGRHQAVLTRLARQLGNELERAQCEAEVLVELDWIISDDTVVRPDLVVVCGPPPERHLESAPTLAAEILSDSSSRRDSVHKRDLYEEQGVDVYMLIDPEQETIEVYRRSQTKVWTAESVKLKIDLTLCGHCMVTIDKSKLFYRGG
jgi:Uma2 family endonuclease